MHQISRSFSCALPVLACVATVAAGLLAGCGGGGGTSTGTANVLLTDSPSCGYDHVYVAVDHVEISSDGNSWTSVPVSASLGRIDLLSLNNGTLISLGQTPLTAGTMADLVLDFNACKSIVVAGASRKYLLKPVVSAVAELVAGKITGTTVAGSHVYAEQQSTSGPVVVTGTVADATTGAFTLWPLQQSTVAGPVDVVIVPPPPSSGTAGYASYIVQNVPVTAGATT